MHDKVLMSQAIDGLNKYFKKVLPINSSVGTFHYQKDSDVYYLLIWANEKDVKDKIKKHLNKLFGFSDMYEDQGLLIHTVSRENLEEIAVLGKLY